MTRSLEWLMAISAIGMIGCHASPVSPTEMRELSVAEAKWASKGFADYSVDVIISCGECPPQSGRLTRVEVVDGNFFRAVVVATGEDISNTYQGMRTPVESQFAWIRRANSEPQLKDLVVTFDAQLGYPTSVSSMYDRSLADGGGAVYLSNVKPLTR